MPDLSFFLMELDLIDKSSWIGKLFKHPYTDPFVDFSTRVVDQGRLCLLVSSVL